MLDGVIRANKTRAIAETNGRVCTIRATGTTAIRGMR
jgi:hypothetical protein